MFSDDEDTEPAAGYKKTLEKGCDPDSAIFDLEKIEQELAKLQVLYETH